VLKEGKDAMSSWLVLDVSYLAYRALHTTGSLSHGDDPTGVTFRKKKRKEASEDEKAAYASLRKQLEDLRTHVLTDMGFVNVFSQKGFEADDLIASVALRCPKNSEAIIVSSDEDLYQLLGSNRMIWNPHKKKILNRKWFKEEYGIEPSQWRTVKALAGCSSDNVPGIPGVGEKTAIKFIKREIKKGTKTYDKFENAETIIKRNLPIVKLPYPGTGKPIPKRDKITVESWNMVMEGFGFISLYGKVPSSFL